jgi:hypothetical protein
MWSVGVLAGNDANSANGRTERFRFASREQAYPESLSRMSKIVRSNSLGRVGPSARSWCEASVGGMERKWREGRLTHAGCATVAARPGAGSSLRAKPDSPST